MHHVTMGAVEPARPIDGKIFRDAMCRVASAVHVVTVRDGHTIAGVTATAMCSLSDLPSSLLICLHQQGQVRALIKPGASLCVNTLRADQSSVADAFAGRGGLPMLERFGHGIWDEAPGEAPALLDSIVNFLCRVESITESSTHSIVIARVVDVHMGCGEAALLYGARQYRSVSLSGSPS